MRPTGPAPRTCTRPPAGRVSISAQYLRFCSCTTCQPRQPSTGGPVRLADLPGVACVEQRLQIPGAPLLDRPLELLLHQLVVDGPLHIPEHAERNLAVRLPGDAGEREGVRGILGPLVVHEAGVADERAVLEV